MDAYGYMIVLCLLLQGFSCQPMVEETDTGKEAATVKVQAEEEIAITPTTTESIPELAKNCTTARGVFGECVTRQRCDYSTSAIDLTLYATRGYVKPCKLGDVCCPFESIVQVSVSNAGTDNTGFDFDDDD